MKDIVLTGDRPTGALHIGHYVGSLKKRVEIQNNYDKPYIMIADTQALTDNAHNPAKVHDNVIEVALDYLAVGLKPELNTFFIQSLVPELTELTMLYLNFVTLARLKRNPTVKNEMHQKKYGNEIPIGFLTYPVSQAADITAFQANVIPVGEDQLEVLFWRKSILNWQILVFLMNLVLRFVSTYLNFRNYYLSQISTYLKVVWLTLKKC